MMGKTITAIIILSIVLLSGCTTENTQEINDNDGTTNNGSAEANEDQIPVPETPDAENQEPPNLPI